VQFRISTFDGGNLPPTARLCLEGEGVDVCEAIFPSARAFAAQPRITIVSASGSAIIVEVHDLPPGAYQLRLTGLAPYADITANLNLDAGGGMTIQPIVVTLPEPTPALPDRPESPEKPTPPTNDASTVTPRSRSDAVAPTTAPSGWDAGVAPTPTPPLVTQLPNTGAALGTSTRTPFILMLLTTLLLLLAALRLRVRGRS
jgi:hypothetical protein